MRTVAIVPVRAPGEGKSRLAGVLSPLRRASLVQGMLERVLLALRQARSVTRIVVVTPDLGLALPAGVDVVHDSGVGLNAAVALALESVAGTADAALVVAADAPQVTAEEIDRIIAATRDADVGIVPDRRGEGTNALWLRLPPGIAPQYGEGSARAHRDAARAAGLRVVVVDAPGLSHDVDLPSDLDGEPMPAEQALLLADEDDLPSLMSRAAELAVAGFGQRVSYSRKVFIPLTQLCRDVCHYCTFAGPPRKGARAFMTPDEVLEVARAGARAGCDEALFTLGDKPELRYRVAREELGALGFATTLEYLAHCARLVHVETGLLPHLNPGVMTPADIAALRPVSVSMGIMLESVSPRLAERGGPHHRSPDKHPAPRLATLQAAGEQQVPFTTGILIGIGETRRERIEALLAIRALHLRYGHIQEIIIQNFRAKPGTRMARHAEPSLDELLWTIAVARRIFGSGMSIQAPPNLSPGALRPLVAAGLNDWGGVSPVTPDHVNPEAPWPELLELERQTEAAGRWLVQRLPVAPSHAGDLARWVDPALHTAVLRRLDVEGYARERDWTAGAGDPPPARYRRLIAAGRPDRAVSPAVAAALDHAASGRGLAEPQIVALFAADGVDFQAVVAAADALRARRCGDAVTYVVNRNINYTNICTYSCGSVRSPRAAARARCAGRATTSIWAKSRDGSPRRGTRAQPRSACRAGSILDTRATPTSRSSGPPVKPRPGSMSTPSRRSRSRTAQAPSACRFAPTSSCWPRRDFARCRARPQRSSATRSGPSSAPTRSARPSGSGSCAMPMPSGFAVPPPSCMATSSKRGTGRRTCWPYASCRRKPRASRSSCRCRSCTWRRRSGAVGGRAADRVSARHCSCIPSRGSYSTPCCPASRPPG
jgi:FO synthase